jgi:DNA-binding NtrC family response regulator
MVPAQPQRSGIDCVFLTSFDAEFAVFASLLRSCGIRMHRADTIEQADFLLTVTEASVLLSDAFFLEGTWDDAAYMLAVAHPSVALVVVVEEMDGAFRMEALNRGVYDLVSRPLLMSKLRQVIWAARHTAREGVARRFRDCTGPE